MNKNQVNIQRISEGTRILQLEMRMYSFARLLGIFFLKKNVSCWPISKEQRPKTLSVPTKPTFFSFDIITLAIATKRSKLVTANDTHRHGRDHTDDSNHQSMCQFNVVHAN